MQSLETNPSLVLQAGIDSDHILSTEEIAFCSSQTKRFKHLYLHNNIFHGVEARTALLNIIIALPGNQHWYLLLVGEAFTNSTWITTDKQLL